MQQDQFKLPTPKEFIRGAMANYNGQSSFWLMVFVNLIPVIGVLFLAWDAYMVFSLYIIESFIIGVFHAIKLMVVNKHLDRTGVAKEDRKISWGSVPFFLIHFNMFLIIQFIIFSGSEQLNPQEDSEGIFRFVHVFKAILRDIEWYALSAIVLNLIYSLLNDFIYSGEYKVISAGRLFFQPYQRVIVQQLVVIIGSFLASALGYVPTVFILLFCLAKIFSDMLFQLYMYRINKMLDAKGNKITFSSDPNQ